MAPKSRTQGLREEDWVRSTKDILVHATNAMELKGCWSLYQLKKLLKITNSSVISDEGGSLVGDCEGGFAWATTN